jgi:predicted ATPase
MRFGATENVSFMLKTLAVANYRSINKLVIPLGRLNLITGPNGSGKSNLYRALRLLAETAQGGVVNALAREGGLDSTFWAGPEHISRRMRNGEVPIEATVRQGVKRGRAIEHRAVEGRTVCHRVLSGRVAATVIGGRVIRWDLALLAAGRRAADAPPPRR